MFEVDRFIEDCRSAAELEAGPSEMLDLMRKTVAEPDELADALARRDSDEPLFHSQFLSIYAVALEPGEVTVPHDHQMWAVVGVYQGAERNRFFHRAPTGLAAAGERLVLRGDAILLDEDVIHAIDNAGQGPLRALHVYGGDLMAAARSMWRPDTGEEHPLEFTLFEAWNEELRRSPKVT